MRATKPSLSWTIGTSGDPVTHYNDLSTRLDDVELTPQQIAAVRRLIAGQPDADTLADALGVAV